MTQSDFSAKSIRRPTAVIQPSRGWKSLNLRELWHFRDLLVILADRDIRVRYKQTALGVIWVILQPLVTAIIFTVIFGYFAKLPSGNSPYILFTFSGLLAWNLFAGSLQRAGNSLVQNSILVSKVYFPRMLVPLASIGAVLIDFTITLVVYVLLSILLNEKFSWNVIALPFFLLLTLLTATGTSLWFSAMSVYYRDFIYILPFLVQAWMYASPVGYSTSLIPEKYQLIYSLNPAVGFIEGFRWSLLGDSSLTWEMVLISSLAALATFASGIMIFRRIERNFADVV